MADMPQREPNKVKEVRKNVSLKMAAMAAKVLGKDKQRSVPDDTAFADRWPNLWEWCTATQIGESIGKDPAKLTYQIADGCWKVTLSDNALQCSLTAIGLTFFSALDALEKLMTDSSAPWVHFKRKGKALRELGKEEKKSLDK